MPATQHNKTTQAATVWRRATLLPPAYAITLYREQRGAANFANLKTHTLESLLLLAKNKLEFMNKIKDKGDKINCKLFSSSYF